MRQSGTVGPKGSRTPALVRLAAEGVDHRVHEYPHDASAPSYGEEAAAALGVAAERVLKTLIVVVDGSAAAAAVLPVDHQLDLKAAAGALGGKRADLAPERDAERLTGYVVGGISPLGQRRKLPTVVDASALDHPPLYVRGGRRGLEIELAPGDLIRLTAAAVAPIRRR
jgi:Cys-tRNA(Pro)/Cys-tRNA(Cys) deacylase